MALIKRVTMIIAVCIVLLITSVFVFLRQAQFGKAPSSARLERIRKSRNFRDGQFQNTSLTPDLKEGVGYIRVLTDFLFKKSKRSKPTDRLPSQKTNLLALAPHENVLVWFGHSTYFMQIDGKKILVDPVLSGSASPVAFTTRSFPGSDVYSVADLPEIDYLFISHDHWDHLDYKTILKLIPNVKKVVTGLGTGEHLEYWGFSPSQVIECIAGGVYHPELSRQRRLFRR